MSFNISEIKKEWAVAKANDVAGVGKYFYKTSDGGFITSDVGISQDQIISQGLEPVRSDYAVEVMEKSNEAEAKMEAEIVASAVEKAKVRENVLGMLDKSGLDDDLIAGLKQLI